MEQILQAAAASGSRVRVPAVAPALLDRVHDLNQDLARTLGAEGRTANHRRITRITSYLQRQVLTSSSNPHAGPDAA